MEDVLGGKVYTWWVHTCEHENCGRFNVRKHRDIKDSDKYITLDLSLKFGSQEKMRIISSDPKDNLGISGKGLITSLGLNTNLKSKKNKRERYAITNVSLKNISIIIKKFVKLSYEGHVKDSSKYRPNNS